MTFSAHHEVEGGGRGPCSRRGSHVYSTQELAHGNVQRRGPVRGGERGASGSRESSGLSMTSASTPHAARASRAFGTPLPYVNTASLRDGDASLGAGECVALVQCVQGSGVHTRRYAHTQ